MPTHSQTQTAVLGALSIRPMTGYAVRENIQNVLGHFWSESFGQIYPTLAELEREGLVERQRSEHPRSSPFAPTAEGLTRLRELLSAPPQPSRPRNGLLLRLFFGRQLGVEACRQLIKDARAQAETQLAQLVAEREQLTRDASLRDDAPYILITILAGEHGARASIAWADDALASLDELVAS